jgi:hypothetical protein
MTPHGAVGRSGIQAYAARNGVSEEAYIDGLGEPLTPEIAGSALTDLVSTAPEATSPAYMLTGAGLKALS